MLCNEEQASVPGPECAPDHRADIVDVNLFAADFAADHIRQQHGVVIAAAVADEHNLLFRVDRGFLLMMPEMCPPFYECRSAKPVRKAGNELLGKACASSMDAPRAFFCTVW